MTLLQAGGAGPHIDGHERRVLADGWQAARTSPGAQSDASGLDGLSWWPAAVPGTAAGVLHTAGAWSPGEPSDLDADDWWFRTRFGAEAPASQEQVSLLLEGVATLAEVYLNGHPILASRSMFIAHAVDVGSTLQADNELVICCRALGPHLDMARRPRARWRTRVAPGSLRFFRTMIIGRAPGFAPGPAAVGPWRPVLLERRRHVAVDELALRPTLRGDVGVLNLHARARGLAGAPLTAATVELSGPSGTHRESLALTANGTGALLAGELRVPGVARWWPHTHGDAALHEVRLTVTAGDTTVGVQAGRVGFRELAAGPGSEWSLERDGLDLHVNGVRVFARGAVWTPVDPVGLAPGESELRATLTAARDAGLNMLRIVGTGAYESAVFLDLCDELGILIWQDFMFANFDYPVVDPEFRALVEREATQQLSRLRGRPSLAVLCGNSEVEQQAAMVGQDPQLARGELFGELLPGLIEACGLDAAYLPSAPCGGELPFRTDRGVANYFGVGAYRRPLQDARRARVRFASECLAFANVPSEATIAAAQSGSHDPPAAALSKAGVPRDVGAEWDFEDVRDHYLQLCFGVDPGALRSSDPARYLELSRAVSGVVMAEVFGEWRRHGSPCGGGLVLWLRDLQPGAGWGIIDHRGEPKVAYHHLRRALAPIAVWMTDEGLNGVDVHVANDRPASLSAQLRVTLYRDLEHPLEESRDDVELEAHTVRRFGVEALLGRFADVNWAYRFGPPGHDAIVASLETSDGTLAQAVRFPLGAPIEPQPADALGLRAQGAVLAGGAVQLEVTSRRLAHGVRIHLHGFTASDDAFTVEPGGRRCVDMLPQGVAQAAEGTVTALNLQGSVPIGLQPAP